MKKGNIVLCHTRIIIPDYNLGDCQKLENLLSVWNDITYTNEPKGFVYDEEKKELIIPRGFSIDYLLKLLGDRDYVVEKKSDEFAKASIRLKQEPRNDLQKKSIAFLLGKGKYASNSGKSQLGLNLDTGDGKTYCVIASLTFLAERAMVITPIDNLKSQWVESFLKFTDISEKSMANISSSDVIDKLLKTKKRLDYKIYFVNHRTLHNYAKNNGWDKITELFKKLKIGLKVYDESHLEFFNIIQIDLHTNTHRTFYVTANFERSDSKEKQLLERCFSGVRRLNSSQATEKRKHIIYIPIFYNSNPTFAEKASMMTKKGMSVSKYADYFVTCQKSFDVLEQVIQKFKGQEGKILILLSTINATEQVFEYIKDNYKDKSVGIYHSKIPAHAKEKSKQCDFIISTQKSMGTGVDIYGLRTVIMTEAYSSSVTANQTAGRLREIEGQNTFYVELIDEGFPSLKRMYNNRVKVFKKKCHSIYKINM